jgi:hypothetical protein
MVITDEVNKIGTLRSISRRRYATRAAMRRRYATFDPIRDVSLRLRCATRAWIRPFDPFLSWGVRPAK